jgi:N-acylneuraminate cytidylyltransferase
MAKQPVVIGLIPARGGSKRIPHKNVKEFCGKPLIAWTIEEAKKSKYISRVIVSTDDPEIVEVAKRYGAEAPFMRPKEISADLTPDLPVFEHLLEWLKVNEGSVPDIIAHLRVTGPMRTKADMDKGISLLVERSEYDSVRAAIPAPLHPLKTYRLDGDTLLPFVPDGVSGLSEPFNLPVQALPKAYAAVGYFSAIRSKTILDQHSMTGKKILGYAVDAKNATDIDTPVDFLVAELRMKERLASQK